MFEVRSSRTPRGLPPYLTPNRRRHCGLQLASRCPIYNRYLPPPPESIVSQLHMQHAGVPPPPPPLRSPRSPSQGQRVHDSPRRCPRGEQLRGAGRGGQSLPVHAEGERADLRSGGGAPCPEARRRPRPAPPGRRSPGGPGGPEPRSAQEGEPVGERRRHALRRLPTRRCR